MLRVVARWVDPELAERRALSPVLPELALGYEVLERRRDAPARPRRSVCAMSVMLNRA